MVKPYLESKVGEQGTLIAKGRIRWIPWLKGREQVCPSATFIIFHSGPQGTE